MQRFVLTIGLCLIVAGCDKPSSGTESPGRAEIVTAKTIAPETIVPETSAPETSAESKSKNTGIDWPDFLGPDRNAKSPETGILSPWPAAGPPLVWQCTLGSGYAGCVTSRGRLFLYERFGDEVRLTCLNAKTGK